jgi:Holliday junction DNA helicase RuvA
VIVESNGIGYYVNITVSAFELLGKTGDEVVIMTHLHVKDNPFGVILYGFSDEKERECFRQIISVSGIGPKTAITILSAMKYSEFIELISKNNYLPLTSISGVGRKTAERLALELKDKITKQDSDIVIASTNTGKSGEIGKAYEVVSALVTLGYGKPDADKMVKAVSGKNGFTEMSAEDVIRRF